MNKRIKGIMIAGGTLAALGSLVPMSSYAASSATKTANIQVTVSPTITVDIVNDANIGEITPNTTGTGSFTTKVTSNKGYTLSLSAPTAADTALRQEGSTSSDTIPAIPNGGTSALPSGTTAWGIQTAAQNGTNNYTGITTSPVVFYTSATGGADLKTTFNVGIMVAPTISSGTYKTTVTVTANTATS